MKKIMGLVFLCVSLSFMGQAQAYILDTGAIPTQGGFDLQRYANGGYQWPAGEVVFTQPETIKSIEAYFCNEDPNNGQPRYGGAAGNITLKVFGNTNAAGLPGPDESNLLLSGSFYKGATDPGGWYGLYNQNLSLGAGSYWFAFEVVDPSTCRGIIASPVHPLWDYLSPPGGYPQAYVWQNNATAAPGSGYWNISGWALNGGSSPFSLRLGDQVTAVPEPVSTALFLLGGATLAVRRLRGKK